MSSMEIAARFLVSGKVQGVFFRASTCEQARRLGLRGHARNLPDGRVEVVSAGTEEAVDALGSLAGTRTAAGARRGGRCAKRSILLRANRTSTSADRRDQSASYGTSGLITE